MSAAATGPLAVFVWKTVADPYVGKISYFRVVSGTFHGDARLWSMPGANEERISQVFYPRGKEQLAATALVAGDIGGVTKLANTGTNDTLSEKASSFELPRPVYPEPLYSVAVSPKTKADSAKMGPALNRVTEEDPSLSWRQEQGTNETILSGMGEQHIELAVRRMETKFGVGLLTAVPKVPYRESITKSASDYHRHKKQTGGAGQFGEVHMEIKPLPTGSGFEFDTTRVFGGAIQNSFFPSIEKGIRSRLAEGPLAGYPVVDVRCEVYDGKMHPVDSKDIAFQIAGREVFKKTFLAAGPAVAGADHGRAHHRARRVHGRHHGRSEHPPRPCPGHGAGQGQGDHHRPGAAGGDAALCDRSALHHAGPRLLHHEAVALRSGAVAHRRRHHRPGQEGSG